MEGFMWLVDFFSTVNANSSASDELCLAPQSMQTREWGGGTLRYLAAIHVVVGTVSR